jgi:Transposase IS4
MAFESRPYDGPRDGRVDESLKQVTVVDWDTEEFYEPIFSRDDLQMRAPDFRLPGDVEPSAAVLQEIYWPDSVLDDIVKCSNAYAKDRVAESKYRPITRADFFRFMAAVTYMGMVKLPAKDDYFPTSRECWFPPHPRIHLNKTRFNYIWRTFHCAYKPGDDETLFENEKERIDDPEDDDDQFYFDAEMEEDEDGAEVFFETEGFEEDAAQYNTDNNSREHKWYSAVKNIINHVNRINKLLLRIPGLILSLDEMLRRFKGRSAMTERLQRKPDKEGYKLFALVDHMTAFCYHFFPSGRLEKLTTEKAVETLLDTLPSPHQIEYVLCMDNFFTRPKCMRLARYKGVGCFGTARRQQGFNPFDGCDDWEFNTVYLQHDQHNYLCVRWIDNAEVLMVSNIHEGYAVVDSWRKRPRENNANRNHVRRLFGSEGATEMEIPEIVNDYNSWMNGVDLHDQLIASFKLKFRCKRTWVPLFLQTMDIARTNSYVLCKQKKKTSTHKKFIQDWIDALNERATRSETNARVTRQQHAQHQAAQEPCLSAKNLKRVRTSNTEPEKGLLDSRLFGERQDHMPTLDDCQKTCRYCAVKWAKARKDGTALPRKGKPKTMCTVCKVHLCASPCFELYHCQDVELN